MPECQDSKWDILCCDTFQFQAAKRTGAKDAQSKRPFSCSGHEALIVVGVGVPTKRPCWVGPQFLSLCRFPLPPLFTRFITGKYGWLSRSPTVTLSELSYCLPHPGEHGWYLNTVAKNER